MTNNSDKPKTAIGAVILAAGYSTRMGQLKALMHLDGISMLQRNISLFSQTDFQNIWVVAGYEKEQVRSAIKDKHVETVLNPDFSKGMFTSIQAGLGAAKDCETGCFLMPVDFPLVKIETLESLIEAVERHPDKFVVPTFHGKKGHPLFIPTKYIDAILTYSGPNGLKGITDTHREDFYLVPVEDEGVVLDVDDPPAFEFAKQYIADGQNSKELAPLAKGRTFVLIRHGEPRQHTGKIFLGQTDIPLSDKGKKQAEDAGRRLWTEVGFISQLYSSDLTRAVETAAIIAGEQSNIHINILEFLREMNLGDWDGKDIDQIKKAFPEEYADRGNHLMEYKRGNKAENFYDLQYRVKKGLISLLEQDPSSTIVIVAHQSVLRAIAHNLQGKDISNPWAPMEFCDIVTLKMN